MSDVQRVASSIIVKCGGPCGIVVSLSSMLWLHPFELFTRLHRGVTLGIGRRSPESRRVSTNGREWREGQGLLISEEHATSDDIIGH